MDKTFEPELATKRQMLEQKRDQFRQVGYDAFLERMAAEVQDPGPSKQAKEAHAVYLKELEAKEANAYAAARRMQELIDALPVEEAKPDGD